MKQKIDNDAKSYLNYISKQFSSYLGEMEFTHDEVIFHSPPEPLKRVKISNRKNKFLLGGLFSLQVTGEFQKTGIEEEVSPIQIRYKGMMIKGRAFFENRKKSNEKLLIKLNNNTKLIDTLNTLDLEKGEIHMREEKAEIRLTPLSGSYMYMVFPPVRYSGSLPKSDIEGLCQALYMICETIKK